MYTQIDTYTVYTNFVRFLRLELAAYMYVYVRYAMHKYAALCKKK